MSETSGTVRNLWNGRMFISKSPNHQHHHVPTHATDLCYCYLQLLRRVQYNFGESKALSPDRKTFAMVWPFTWWFCCRMRPVIYFYGSVPYLKTNSLSWTLLTAYAPFIGSYLGTQLLNGVHSGYAAWKSDTYIAIFRPPSCVPKSRHGVDNYDVGLRRSRHDVRYNQYDDVEWRHGVHLAKFVMM